MRIVVDVTPLALPRTGIGNYVLGMLRGLGEAGAEHEIVAFSAVAPPGKRRIAQALDGVPVERRLVVVPPKSHWWRTAWSRLGRGPVEWLAGPLDVFHFSDWMYPPQRGGVRATTIHDLVPAPPSGLGAPADLPHALAQVRPRRADVRPDRRQLRVHRRGGRRAARLPAGADLRRLSRNPCRLSRPTGPRATSAARTSSPWRRWSGGRTSRRCSRRWRSSESSTRSFASPSSGRRAGRGRAWTARASSPLGYVEDEELAALYRGAARLRLPVALRGLRHADRRGDGVRERRWSPRRTPRWTRRAATPRSARTPTAPRRSPPASSRLSRTAMPSSRRARARAAVHRTRPGRGGPPGVPGRSERVPSGRDDRPPTSASRSRHLSRLRRHEISSTRATTTRRDPRTTWSSDLFPKARRCSSSAARRAT